MHMAMILLRLALFALMMGSVCDAVAAAAKDESKPAKEASKKGSSAFELNKKDPIYITADWMEVDQTKNTITYKGRVVTIQGDMTMRSETLTGYIDPETKKMKQIIAEGKVNATQGDRIATGEKAVFDDAAKTVTLTGSPMMRQGNSQVTGAKIVYFTEQDKATVERDEKIPVRATIFPEELKNREQEDAKQK